MSSADFLFIFDDDRASFDAVKSVLSEIKIDFSTESNPVQAIHTLHEYTQVPKLIIICCHTIASPGFALCEKIQSLDHDAPPVLFIIPEHNENTVLKCFEAGATDCIVLPRNKEELHARISTHLKHRSNSLFCSLYTEHVQEVLDKRTNDFLQDRNFYDYLNDLLNNSIGRRSFAEVLQEGLDKLLKLHWMPENCRAKLFTYNADCALFGECCSSGEWTAENSIAPEFLCREPSSVPPKTLCLTNTDSAAHDTPQLDLLCRRLHISIVHESKTDAFLYLEFPREHSFSTMEHCYLVSVTNTLGSIFRHKSAEANLHRQLYFDSLTRLPNRKSLEDRLAEILQEQWPASSVALCFFDLQKFNMINDSFGRKEGDRILQSVARRLSALKRSNVLITRLGSDTFGALLTGLEFEREARHFVKTVQQLFDQPFRSRYMPNLYLSCVASIAFAERDCQPNELIQDAEAALTVAKNLGPRSCVTFNEGMHAQAQKNLRTLNQLQKAIESEQFTVHYQPIVHSPTTTIAGAEALVRWNHPKHGLLLPGAFIPVAETSKLIVPIGEFVFRQACLDYPRLKELAGSPDNFTLNVNLAAAQLNDLRLSRKIVDILHETQREPQDIKLEVTETDTARDPQKAARTLHALREIGLKIALDDFGTGYSSLSRLIDLPLDTLKVDKCFVSELNNNAQKRRLVDLIISTGEQLGLNVIAEGVENKTQVTALFNMRCTFIQGFYYSRPVAVPQFGILNCTNVPPEPAHC
ncbi:EAL domain-containing protein [Desulfobaculum bizertense]|uniref:two-component system response regulator n=1 Tax=Desulfobaculum bizertense TaxID=376490 RepID=UPI001F463B35|nr:EAL domain-containing protein [Desulfobaculum bizertense]UIJ36825.1 EAL domain-containing protein [Desulfobaculum bizertense]